MRYTHKNCMPGTKVYEGRFKEVRRVRWVDMDRSVIGVTDNPPKLNAARTEVLEHEVAFERIEISKRCPQSNLPMEFRCYGRLSD